MIVRRRFLKALAASTGCSFPAAGMGRTPYGGHLRLSIPWGMSSLDPHNLNDPIAAFFGPSVFEPLFSVYQGKPNPSLAVGFPVADGDDCIVSLRPGLRSSTGKPLTGRDLLWSLARSRGLGGACLLREFGKPKKVNTNPLAVRIPKSTPAAVAVALTSPLTALVSRHSTPEKPDGCGPFKAMIDGNLILTRNQNAARGPAFLDRISCSYAASLAAALRDFEVGRSDVGWLGRGLHRVRPDSQLMTLKRVGWLVLRTGAAAGPFAAPGTAGQLVAGLDRRQLSRFGIEQIPSNAARASYSGPPGELLVREDSGYLLELGRTLSALLSSRTGQLTLRAISPRALKQRKRSGDYSLLLDIIRSPGTTPRAERLSLLNELAPKLVDRAPPASGDEETALADSTRTLPLGIVGSLNIRVALTQEFAQLGAWDLGNAWKPRPEFGA